MIIKEVFDLVIYNKKRFYITQENKLLLYIREK